MGDSLIKELNSSVLYEKQVENHVNANVHYAKCNAILLV